MQMVIAAQADGGGCGFYARLLARHIPGNPRLMPAGLIRALIEAPGDLKALMREATQSKKQDTQEIAGGVRKGGG